MSPVFWMVWVMVAVSPTEAPDAEVTVTVWGTFQAVAPVGVKVSVAGVTVAWVVSSAATATVTLPAGWLLRRTV